MREGDKTGEVTTIINDFVPTYTVMVLSKDELVNEKMRALFNRQKARDFYDLYFLLRANLVGENSKATLQAVLDALHGTTIRFDRELKRFLPKSHWPIIRELRSALEREIQRYL